jgi:hypothetical protein
MLNLRQVGEDPGNLCPNGNGTVHGTITSFNLSTVIGNMGESFQYDTQSYLEEESDDNVMAHTSGLSVPSDKGGV